jgi:hypothetical protein
MDTKPAGKRGRALKEAAVRRTEAQAAGEAGTSGQEKALAVLSGITDDSVLEALLTLGISGDTLAAVSLAPLTRLPGRTAVWMTMNEKPFWLQRNRLDWPRTTRVTGF